MKPITSSKAARAEAAKFKKEGDIMEKKIKVYQKINGMEDLKGYVDAIVGNRYTKEREQSGNVLKVLFADVAAGGILKTINAELQEDGVILTADKEILKVAID